MTQEDTKLRDIDNPALYDAMDLMAHFQDEGWDSERLYEACRIVLELGGAVDEYAEKLNQLRIEQARLVAKKREE